MGPSDEPGPLTVSLDEDGILALLPLVDEQLDARLPRGQLCETGVLKFRDR
jgi:hypothetical protein